MIIGPNTSAEVSYTLILDEDGSEIENVKEDQPAVFKFGINKLLPKFEENLNGLKQEDTFEFIMKANDAYGLVDQYAIFDIPKDTFEVDGKIDAEMLQLGNRIPMTDDQGNKHLGKIIKVLEDAVTLDFNHPLAGKDLKFKGKILNVKQSES